MEDGADPLSLFVCDDELLVPAGIRRERWDLGPPARQPTLWGLRSRIREAPADLDNARSDPWFQSRRACCICPREPGPAPDFFVRVAPNQIHRRIALMRIAQFDIVRVGSGRSSRRFRCACPSFRSS